MGSKEERILVIDLLEGRVAGAGVAVGELTPVAVHAEGWPVWVKERLAAAKSSDEVKSLGRFPGGSFRGDRWSGRFWR